MTIERKLRQDLEISVMYAIITSNAFAQVNNLLSEKNFKEPFFAEIFSAAKELFPTSPIDLLTLAKKLRADQHALNCLYSIVEKSHYSFSVPYNCFILLQLDITEAFKKSLLEWREERLAENEKVEAAVITDVYENILPDEDILHLIQKTQEYFAQHGMELEKDLTRKFNADIDQKAFSIKKNISLDIALSTVFRLAESNSEVAAVSRRFAQAISTMVITGTVKENYNQAAALL